jgi:hypothetical protein
MNHWQPLFDGFEQERILSTARQVLDVASTVPRSPFDWGLPLLLNYSALVTGADDLNAAADDLLDCAIEQVSAACTAVSRE